MVVGHVDSSTITTIVILRAAAGVEMSFIELLGLVCVPLEYSGVGQDEEV